jgi:hypothetical protein
MLHPQGEICLLCLATYGVSKSGFFLKAWDFVSEFHSNETAVYGSIDLRVGSEKG